MLRGVPGGVSGVGTKSLKVPGDPRNHFRKFKEKQKITIFDIFKDLGI